MTDDIQKLESELNALKRKQSEKAWLDWKEKTKNYLNTLKGKAFMTYTSRDCWYMYKILRIEEKGYFNFPKWKGWFELITEGDFVFRYSSYHTSVQLHNEKTFLNQANLIFRKKKKNSSTELITLMIPEYSNNSLGSEVMLDASNIARVGHQMHTDENSQLAELPPPKYFTLGICTYHVPDEFYNELISIYKNHIEAVAKFNLKWEDKIKNFTEHKGNYK